MTSAIVEITEGTAPGAESAGVLGLFANTSHQFGTVDPNGNVLLAPVIREAEILAVRPQFSSNLIASPTGITSATGVMLGLSNTAPAVIVTPQVTGRLRITICGVVAQSTTADGATWAIRTGTGAAPANAAALTGAQSGGQQSMTFLTGLLKIPFSITTVVTGLTLNTAVWIDLAVQAITGGTATLTQVQVNVEEF